jgi:Calx-beta domain/Bacterial Ig domain
MARLTASCRTDPLARIEVRNGAGRSLVVATGEVELDVPAGLYELRAAARGRNASGVVSVGSDDSTIEVDLGPYASAAPTVRSLTFDPGLVRILDEQLTGTAPQPGAGLLTIVLRPVGEGVGPHDADVEVESVGGPVAWRLVDGIRCGAAATAPGLAVVRSTGPDASAVAVPVWPDWQTLVFIPVVGSRVIMADLAVHCLNAGARWSEVAGVAESTEQLIGAHIDADWAATGGSFSGFRPGIEPSTPLQALLAGDLDALRRLAHDQPVATAEVAAMEIRDNSRPSVAPVTALPVLAASADELLRYESSVPWSLGGDLAAAYTTRLASPVWFRWRPDPDLPAVSGEPDSWSQTVEEFGSRDHSVGALRRLTSRGRASAASLRLAVHAADRSQARDLSPRQVLAQPVGDLVLTTGLPAVALERGLADTMRGLRRGRWLRRLGIVSAVVLVVLLATPLVWPEEDSDGPGLTTTPTTTPTTGSTTSGSTTSTTTAGPVAVADTRETPVNVPITIAVTANDNGLAEETEVVIDRQPVSGTVEVDGLEVTYTPDDDFAGTDTFTYLLDAAGRRSAPAEVTVGVRPTVSIADVSDSSPGEGQSVVVSLQLNVPSADLVTVHYATADGTAVAGADYTATGGEATFEPETTDASLTVAVLADGIAEFDDETFTVTLSSPTNAFLGSPATVTITIPGDVVD